MALFGGDSTSNTDISPFAPGVNTSGSLGGYTFVNNISVRAGNKQNSVSIAGDLNAEQEFSAIMHQLDSWQSLIGKGFEVAIALAGLYGLWRVGKWVLA